MVDFNITGSFYLVIAVYFGGIFYVLAKSDSALNFWLKESPIYTTLMLSVFAALLVFVQILIMYLDNVKWKK